MANILVTGGAGYIGSHTCKALKASGHNPIVLDNLSRGFNHSVKWGPFVEGDIRDFDLVCEALKSHKIDAVIHFAAFAYVQESVEKPDMYFENNVEGSVLLLEAMKESGVKNFVFSSSCATYGESKAEKIDESHPQSPVNPYGLSKLMVEKIMKRFKENHEFQICGLRYFNVGGADPEGEIGENHDPEPHIIPNILKSCHGEQTLNIFGTDYPTPDGTCVRDFIHVSDLAMAHVIAVEAVLKKSNQHDFYNLSGNSGCSLLELVETCKKVTGKNPKINMTDRREGDPAFLVGDPKRFLNEFDWNPQYSDIQTIVETALKWHRS